MKAMIRTSQLTMEAEGQTQSELFKKIAEIQEIFAEPNCGLCSSEDLQFKVRTVDGNDFHEMVCLSCGAKLSFGQSKKNKGALFPIRQLTKDGKPSRKDGEYGKHKGWTKYRGKPVIDNEE